MPKKNLDRSEEDFFMLVLLMFGEPPPAAEIKAFRFNQFEMGTTAWLKHTHRGQIFMRCVIECGEAKARAGKWYYRYIGWHKKRERL